MHNESRDLNSGHMESKRKLTKGKLEDKYWGLAAGWGAGAGAAGGVHNLGFQRPGAMRMT